MGGEIGAEIRIVYSAQLGGIENEHINAFLDLRRAAVSDLDPSIIKEIGLLTEDFLGASRALLYCDFRSVIRFEFRVSQVHVAHQPLKESSC